MVMFHSYVSLPIYTVALRHLRPIFDQYHLIIRHFYVGVPENRAFPQTNCFNGAQW